MKKRYITILAAAAVALCSVLAAGALSRDAKLLKLAPMTDNSRAAEKGLDADTKDWVLSEDAMIVEVLRFSKCGHEVVSRRPADESEKGMALEEFKNNFPGWSMMLFEQHVQLVGQLDQYCPRHYMLLKVGQGVYAYNNRRRTERMELVKKLDIDAALMEQHHPQVNEGMIFDSLDELEMFLESFGS